MSFVNLTVVYDLIGFHIYSKHYEFNQQFMFSKLSAIANPVEVFSIQTVVLCRELTMAAVCR